MVWIYLSLPDYWNPSRRVERMKLASPTGISSWFGSILEGWEASLTVPNRCQKNGILNNCFRLLQTQNDPWLILDRSLLNSRSVLSIVWSKLAFLTLPARVRIAASPRPLGNVWGEGHLMTSRFGMINDTQVVNLKARFRFLKNDNGRSSKKRNMLKSQALEKGIRNWAHHKLRCVHMRATEIIFELKTVVFNVSFTCNTIRNQVWSEINVLMGEYLKVLFFKLYF